MRRPYVFKILSILCIHVSFRSPSRLKNPLCSLRSLWFNNFLSLMRDLTLVVLAAGMGSRYGGVKQMEGLGPTREVLLDYSVFDAIRAGFTKAVIVIRQ